MRGWTLHGRKYRKIPGKVKRTCITWKEEKGILEIQEINDFFSDMELDSDQMEKYSITWKQIMLMCSESVMMTMIYRMIL